eukprot:8481110-Alexandrium_andersonii.AAC.1
MSRAPAIRSLGRWLARLLRATRGRALDLTPLAGWPLGSAVSRVGGPGVVASPCSWFASGVR